VIVSGSRSVAVLGPIPRDRIVTHRGEVLEKYGCALYTVAALSALLDPDDRIYPIVHVRRKDEEPIKELLSAFPNVDVTGVRSASDHGAVVELRYVDQNTRIEQQVGFMDPITPADVEFALAADAFVCVPITDYEVGQATLAYIKQHSAGTILLDAHGPTSTLVIGGSGGGGCGWSVTPGCPTSTC
jgi:adenosine kinase